MNDVNRILMFFLSTGRLEKQVVRLKSLYMKELGLKGADLPVLLCLVSHEDGIRMDEICRLTELDKSQVSRTLISCMNAGLICREEGRAYKRRYSLSPKGREACQILSEEAEKILEKAHENLDDECWLAFYGFMDRLSDSVDDMIAQMEKHPEETELRKQMAGLSETDRKAG